MTMGRLSPLEPNASRVAQFAAAAFSEELGLTGTTILPLIASATPSLFVSVIIHPAANALLRWLSVLEDPSAEMPRLSLM